MAIEPEYGSGFSVRQLEICRQFYRAYPIANTLCSQLNWSQYKLLIAIPDKDKREYYQLEAVNEGWSKRQLERQINSILYERLLMSNDKEKVLAVARKERTPESPLEMIKDPMVLAFLGLERKPAYYEKDLESALLSHIADFLLELGKGFSFVARQKRLLIEDDEYFVDLVFYNRLLRSFVVIELKTYKLTIKTWGSCSSTSTITTDMRSSLTRILQSGYSCVRIRMIRLCDWHCLKTTRQSLQASTSCIFQRPTSSSNRLTR